MDLKLSIRESIAVGTFLRSVDAILRLLGVLYDVLFGDDFLSLACVFVILLCLLACSPFPLKGRAIIFCLN